MTSVVIEELDVLAKPEPIRNLKIVRTMQYGELATMMYHYFYLFIFSWEERRKKKFVSHFDIIIIMYIDDEWGEEEMCQKNGNVKMTTVLELVNSIILYYTHGKKSIFSSTIFAFYFIMAHFHWHYWVLFSAAKRERERERCQRRNLTRTKKEWIHRKSFWLSPLS